MNRRQRLARRLLPVLWPSFLLAGVLEMMVFAVLDPDAMSWPGGTPFDWSLQAVYSVSFFIFWGVIATSAGLTMLLASRQRASASSRMGGTNNQE